MRLAIVLLLVLGACAKKPAQATSNTTPPGAAGAGSAAMPAEPAGAPPAPDKSSDPCQGGEATPKQ